MANGDTTRFRDSIPYEFTVPLRDFDLSSGFFEELFHSEFSEYVDSTPILDKVAPLCPTNIRLNVSTENKRMILTWYYPLNTNTDTIQNDIKEFEVYEHNSNGDHILLTKTTIPLFIYQPKNEQEVSKATLQGIQFTVRAIDYHDLKSPYSMAVEGKFNSNYSCSKDELPVKIISRGCDIESKERRLSKKLMFNSDSITISPGSYVGVKDEFKNKTVTLRLILKDKNTGYEFSTWLYIVHDTKKVLGTYSTFTTKDVLMQVLKK